MAGKIITLMEYFVFAAAVVSYRKAGFWARKLRNSLWRGEKKKKKTRKKASCAYFGLFGIHVTPVGGRQLP